MFPHLDRRAAVRIVCKRRDVFSIFYYGAALAVFSLREPIAEICREARTIKIGDIRFRQRMIIKIGGCQRDAPLIIGKYRWQETRH